MPRAALFSFKSSSLRNEDKSDIFDKFPSDWYPFR